MLIIKEGIPVLIDAMLPLQGPHAASASTRYRIYLLK